TSRCSVAAGAAAAAVGDADDERGSVGFFECQRGHRRDLHSFPTRRSSDLGRRQGDQDSAGGQGVGQSNVLRVGGTFRVIDRDGGGGVGTGGDRGLAGLGHRQVVRSRDGAVHRGGVVGAVRVGSRRTNCGGI